jgi:HK97 gp10 family phage protein
MAFTRSSSSQASRIGTRGGVVIEGLDLVVSDFTRKAATLQPAVGAATVRYAAKAAERMRNRVPIDEGDLLNSVTADQTPTFGDGGVYADAGPDLAIKGGFKGHLIEHGTVKMGPQPFVGPAADETFPEFEDAIKHLGDL